MYTNMRLAGIIVHILNEQLESNLSKLTLISAFKIARKLKYTFHFYIYVVYLCRSTVNICKHFKFNTSSLQFILTHQFYISTAVDVMGNVLNI